MKNTDDLCEIACIIIEFREGSNVTEILKNRTAKNL